MKIYIPVYNPVRFYRFEPTLNDRYNSRLLKDFQYEHTVLDFQNSNDWTQPWQVGDVIRLQIMSDTPGLVLKAIDCNKQVLAEQAFVQKMTNWKETGTETYEAEIKITTEYKFYLSVWLNDKIILISDPQQSYDELGNSLLCEYKHRKNINDLAFDTGIIFELRVPSVLSEPLPNSEIINYINQRHDRTLINAAQWLAYKWTIGDAYGVPNYFIEILNNAIGVSEFYLDGTLYSRAEDNAKFDRIGDSLYAMAGWTILLTESKNRTSYIYNISDTSSSDDLLINTGERIIVAENKILNI